VTRPPKLRCEDGQAMSVARLAVGLCLALDFDAFVFQQVIAA
jgi:hypothetical protein